MTDASIFRPKSRTLLTRTLWRIETGLGGDISLADLAASDGVGPFHLSRAFTLSLGTSVMAYVKARRLTEAVRALRTTNVPIVEIAFAAGYHSHEGFSRSFGNHFGHSPSTVRANPELPLTLQDPIIMPNKEHSALEPRFETRPDVRLAGVTRRYTMATRASIPQQWEHAIAEMGDTLNGTATYGACYDFEDESFSYLIGIPDDGRLDTERFDHVKLPAGKYAVFEHTAHISSIADTWSAIFEAWMPGAKVAPREGPEFELYEPDFDPETPGGVSVWIPVRDIE